MLNLILATDFKGCIWKNNQLCWNLKKDLKFFSEKTKGQVVIMWKNTYLSLPEAFRPLPWRVNFVVSRSLKDEKVQVFPDLDQAIQEAKKLDKEIFLIGWKSVYEKWIDLVDRVYLTQVEGEFDCDVCLDKIFFDKLKQNFKLKDESEIFEENGIKFKFLEFIRK